MLPSAPQPRPLPGCRRRRRAPSARSRGTATPAGRSQPCSTHVPTTPQLHQQRHHSPSSSCYKVSVAPLHLADMPPDLVAVSEHSGSEA